MIDNLKQNKDLMVSEVQNSCFKLNIFLYYFYLRNIIIFNLN